MKYGDDHAIAAAQNRALRQLAEAMLWMTRPQTTERGQVELALAAIERAEKLIDNEGDEPCSQRTSSSAETAAAPSAS